MQKHLQPIPQSLPYSYRPQIQPQLLSALPPHILTTTNSPKVIRTATSILKLNLLQCSMLSYLLRHSRFSLMELSVSATNITLFEDDNDKQLLLLVLLNAFYVKTFLNNNISPQIDAEILALVPHFALLYRGWRPDSSLQNVSLVQLNASFTRWSGPQKKNKMDYNQLVCKILQLSKTYNVGGNQQQPPRKKRKMQKDQSEMKSQIISQQIPGPKEMMHSRILRSRQRQQQDKAYNIWDAVDPSQQDIIRMSDRNMRQSYNYMNLRDLGQSRYSQYNMNMNHSLLNSGSRVLRDNDDVIRSSIRGSLRNKFRVTSSFDQFFK